MRRYPVIKQLRFTAEQGEWLALEAARLGVSENGVLRRAVSEYRDIREHFSEPFLARLRQGDCDVW